MLWTCQPRLGSVSFMDFWIGPNKFLSSLLNATSSRALAGNFRVVQQDLGLLELGTQVHGYGFGNNGDFIERASFWSLGIGDNHSKIRQEDCPCKAEPHQPAINENRCHDADHANSHGGEVFHHAAFALYLGRFADRGDALGFVQGFLC